MEHGSAIQISDSELPEEIYLLGARMHPWSMRQTLDVIDQRLRADVFTQHVVVNVGKLVTMRHDELLQNSVDHCDIINIDGMGVVWGARLMGYYVPERVAGIDLFYALLEYAESMGKKVYLLGAREDVIVKAADEVQRWHPRLQLAGFHHGYFWEDELAMVEEIAASGADLLFVAITSPRKEQFIDHWRDRLGVKFAMGVGGTFDIVAGITRRAPIWMQKAGLEWLYRVLQEPGRMWRRYLVTNSKYLFLLLKQWFCLRLLNRNHQVKMK